jgi:hypothetical protein
MNNMNRVFSLDQKKLLVAVLDRIIPAEGHMPGAGELGVADYIEGVVQKDPRVLRLFLEGLDQIRLTTTREERSGFTELPSPAKDVVLQRVETDLPAFFDELVRQTYNAYYTDPNVFEGIGYILPTPQAKSSNPALLDPDRLEQQRGREPFWTQV